MHCRAALAAIALLGSIPLPSAADWLGDARFSGNAGAEYRYFAETGPRPDLYRSNTALSASPELYIPLADSRDSLSLEAYYLWDEHDNKRSHGDIRELNWHKVERSWELTLGVDRVFWGVTETVHLVNIINQQDFVVNPDGEELLGQPMAHLSLIRNWGVLELFLLPYFRERTFPGINGRPSSNLVVSDKAEYESGAKQWHTDAAVRWSDSIDAWDMGAYYFYGTSRDPRFDADLFEVDRGGRIELIPIYDIIHQVGVDVQATFDAWLWKLEAIYRDGRGGNFFASAAGFEYTFFDVAGSGTDVGIISEYLHDARKWDVTTDDDLSFGVRLTFNDINSSDVLFAIVQDLDNRSYYFFVEASRRLGDAFRLSLEARGVGNVETGDALQVYDDDNYLQLGLNYFF